MFLTHQNHYMKKKILLTILSACLLLLSFGQKVDVGKKNLSDTCKLCGQIGDCRIKYLCDSCKSCDVIYYDFKCKEFFKADSGCKNLKPISPREFNVRYNKKLKFQVINVNRYVYDVGVIADDIQFGSESPAVFNQLFLGAGDFMTNIISELSFTNPDLEKADDPITKFLLHLSLFKEYVDSLHEVQINVYTICKGEPPCCNEKDKFSGAFSTLSKLLFEAKSEYINVANEFTKILNEQSKRIKDAEEMNAKFQTLLKEEKEKFEKEKDPKKKGEIQKKISETEENIVKSKNTIDAAKGRLKEIEERKGNIEKYFTNYFSKITDEELMKLILFSNNYIKDHFAYQSPPIYPQGNRLSLQFGITARDSSLIKKWNINPVYNDSIHLSLPVVGKSFLFFSTGPFLGLSKKTRNEVFNAQAQPNSNNVITDSAKYKIIDGGMASKPLGIAGLATYGIRLWRGGGLGFSAGAGVSIEPRPRPNYLAGLSLFAGDLSQFNLTFGLNFLQVDRFNNTAYSDLTNTLYDQKPEIEYKRKSEIGCFLSLSYTVFTPNSKRSVKSGSK